LSLFFIHLRVVRLTTLSGSERLCASNICICWSNLQRSLNVGRRQLASGIVNWNTAGSMDVCPFSVLCVVIQKSLPLRIYTTMWMNDKTVVVCPFEYCRIFTVIICFVFCKVYERNVKCTFCDKHNFYVVMHFGSFLITLRAFGFLCHEF